jgi:hypothetical protein
MNIYFEAYPCPKFKKFALFISFSIVLGENKILYCIWTLASGIDLKYLLFAL